MKANELRIGNYIMANSDNVTEQVIKLEKNKINACNDTFFKPIPLTENNLLKIYASDISPNKTYCFAGDKISVSIRFLKDGKSNICIMTDDEEIYIRNYIKYIHTFQNLIFALTNKELTLK